MSYTVRFQGITKGEGGKGDIVTAQMIRDQLIYILDEQIANKYLLYFSISYEHDNMKKSE